MAPTTENDNIEIDDGMSDDEEWSDRGSTLDTLTSLMKEHRYENGRRYGAWKPDNYRFPNDQAESDRLGIVWHMYRLLMGGRTHMAPLGDDLKDVLDIGCGDAASILDLYDELKPSVQDNIHIIGIDISPIQPVWIPNEKSFSFQVDDIEETWNFRERFDYIRCYNMIGSIQNWPKLLQQCYTYLKPGGWLEVGESWFDLQCDDGTMPQDTGLGKWSKTIHAAADKMGRSFTPYKEWEPVLKEQGFVNTQEWKYILPVNAWPKDATLKEVGKFHRVNLEEALEPVALMMMVSPNPEERWTKEDVDKLVSEARVDLRKKNIHCYHPFNITIGQKPES